MVRYRRRYQPKQSKPERVRAFVYGTLRVGDYNHARFAADNKFSPATAEGRLYHVSPRGRVYPVAKFDEEGTIIGEVIEFTPDTWMGICSMEQGAGYELAQVRVTYGDGSTETVGAWHYSYEPRGPRIESGDWFDT